MVGLDGDGEVRLGVVDARLLLLGYGVPGIGTRVSSNTARKGARRLRRAMIAHAGGAHLGARGEQASEYGA